MESSTSSLLLLSLLALISRISGQGTICAVDIALVIDRSGSIVIDFPDGRRPENWEAVKNFAFNIVNQLDIGTDIGQSSVGIATFSTKARLEFPMGELSKQETLDRIRNLEYSGGQTNTSGGLTIANQQIFTQEILQRQNVSNVLLLMTDGKATRGNGFNTDLQQVVNSLKSKGIRIIAVGITQSIDLEELCSIVTNCDTDIIEVDQFDQLIDFILQAINSVCEITTTTTTTTPTTSPTVDCSRCCLRTCDDRFPTCAFPPECPEECPRRCPPQQPFWIQSGSDAFCGTPNECPRPPCVEKCLIDLVAIIDESGSVSIDSTNQGGRDYWNEDMKPFFRNVLTSLDIGLDETRVGLVKFNDDSRKVWGLDDISTKDAMLDKFEIDPCECETVGGRTNTSGALRFARTQMFLEVEGDRQDVENVGILITDGADNIENQNFFNEADQLQAIARLVAVGVGVNSTTEARLRQAVGPNGYYINVANFERIGEILDELVDEACNKCPGDCPEPTPIGNVHAFDAYTLQTNVNLAVDDVIRFDQSYTNIGGGFDPSTGIYTCPCKGLYYFEHECNGVECTLGTAIYKEDQLISTAAYAKFHGTTTTGAVTVCLENEQVEVKVIDVDSYDRTFDFSINNMPKCGFRGYMIEPLA